MASIAFYGSHNASYVIENNGEILGVVEAERILNQKNVGIAQYLVPRADSALLFAEYIPKFLMKKFGIEHFDTCYYLNTDINLDDYYQLEQYIPADNYIHGFHHEAHAAGAFYQSPFEKALCFSFDAGGNDGKFNVYYCERGRSPVLLEQLLSRKTGDPFEYYDLGFPYMIFGEYLADIKNEGVAIGNLTYSGKIMGLASYGNVIPEWLPHFIDFYKNDPQAYNVNTDKHYYSFEEDFERLGEKIGIDFNREHRLVGMEARNVVATSQRAFEECFLEIAVPYFKKFPDLPVCMTGGCALNIILNTRLVEEFNREVFVPPDPNDSGIALGMMLNVLKPKEPFVSTYSGLELLDIDGLLGYIQNVHTPAFTPSFVDIKEVARDLAEGKIIGVARGRSEHGPRALGNRSILCNPRIANMKDVLNEKVKHRESFRPYAPVVRLEDVSKYFEWDRPSTWMSFCPKVRQDQAHKIPAVTHVDGTARVQTVTEEQHPWLYALLGEFYKKSGIGVLLNTSFNVQGKPILSSVKDAFKIFSESEMDGLIIEDIYFKKK